MAYIGKEPIVGNFQVCDAISVVNGQAAYTMQVSSTNVVPESANHMLVSLNGILQKPNSSFTVSSSTITFASALATGDVIDFIILLGNVLDLGVPSDATVTDAKANFVSTSSAAGLQIKGDGTTDGTLQLNCSQNSHGIKLKSPAHSTSSSYTLTFPGTDPSADKFLKTDGSGNLSFADAGGGIDVYDHYRLSAHSGETSSNATISSNWEANDNATFERIGTAMSQSSGIFTFPSTGKYIIFAQAACQARSGNADQLTMRIEVTTDNSSYNAIAQAETECAQNAVASVFWHELFDVTDVSTHKAKMTMTVSQGSSMRILGDTGKTRTGLSFMRIGDT